MSSRSARMGPAQIVAKLKKEHPKIYRELVAKRPPIPASLLRHLTKRGQALADGKLVRISVYKGAFLAEAQLFWEGLDAANFVMLGFRPSPPHSEASAKKTLQLLWDAIEERNGDSRIVENISDEIYGSKPFKDFRKEVVAFDKEIQAAQNTYDFDYDRDINIYSEYL